MKIEIIDRPYWVDKVEKLIAQIEKIRDDENKRTEADWEVYKSKWWNFIKKDTPLDSRFAWRHLKTFYPTSTHQYQYERLMVLLRSLKSEKTGVIYLEQKDTAGLL